ncbi:MAG TPA: glycosyltransferase family 4 protein, partial [Burkholderiales bacterium]
MRASRAPGGMAMNAGGRLRIVHTESSCGWGGQEMRVLDEAEGLRARGHDVRIACPGEARIFIEARGRGIPAEALPIARKSLRGLLALRAWLRSTAPDVINTHSSTDSWLVALGQRAVPVVRTRHISAPIRRNRATRWLYRSAAHVVSTGEALRAEIIQAAGLAPGSVTSVPTGVDLARFVPGDRAASRAALGLPADGPLVGIVATLRSWKGHSFLVDAIARLPDPRVRLAIVGHGPGWGPLHEQVAALGIEDRVIFAGQQADVVPWLQAFDLFVLPSWANEGVPQAIQQAMACGLPVVTTAVGAIGEIVTDAETGVFVPGKDSAAIAGALTRLLADADAR